MSSGNEAAIVRYFVQKLMPTLPHLLPPPGVDIQEPSIIEGVVIVINPTSHQQYRLVVPIVEAACSMVTSPHWPWSSIRFVQFGPLL